MAQIRKDIYSQGEWNLGNGLDIRGTGTKDEAVNSSSRVPTGPQSRIGNLKFEKALKMERFFLNSFGS